MASIPKVPSADQLANVTHTRSSTSSSRKTAGGEQSNSKVEEQGRPRAPTPFQEIPDSSEENLATIAPEAEHVTSPVEIVEEEKTGTTTCEEGRHEFQTKHGMMGILMALALFPCGLICFFRDREEVCVKCGVHA